MINLSHRGITFNLTHESFEPFQEYNICLHKSFVPCDPNCRLIILLFHYSASDMCRTFLQDTTSASLSRNRGLSPSPASVAGWVVAALLEDSLVASLASSANASCASSWPPLRKERRFVRDTNRGLSIPSRFQVNLVDILKCGGGSGNFLWVQMKRSDWSIVYSIG